MKAILLALLVVVVPFTTFDYVLDNQLEQNAHKDIGVASNYTMESLTQASNTDRAQYMTFNNRTDGIDIVHYDPYQNVWHVRENIDGLWTNTALASAGGNNPLPFEYVSTSFGIFNVLAPQTKTVGNCPSNQANYNFTVSNLSNNSNLHLQFDFCAPGTISSPLLAVDPASVGDNFFSFGFTTCGSNGFNSQAVYVDHLVTVFSNGTYNKHSFSARFGIGGYTYCSNIKSPHVIASDSISCITAEGDSNGGHTGVGDTMVIQCVNHINNSQVFSSNFCRGQYGACATPQYYSTSQDIYYREVNQNNYPAPPTYTLWKINETGFHDLSSNWLPENCYDTYPHIIDSPFLCTDSLWSGSANGGMRIWYPGDNSTEGIPEQLESVGDFTSFKAGNIGQHKNWIFINSNALSGYDISISWSDYDLDSHHDLLDDLPLDSTQHADLDEDGYGDSLSGNNPDSCPYQFGDSIIDRYGCSDFDDDGYSDLGDIFPSDYWQWNDTDGDGYGDNNFSSSGYLNTTFRGTTWDSCPNEYGASTRNNTLGCPDLDFDGWADSLDVFDDDSSQWADVDGDGYGDQLNGFQGDACPITIGTSTQDRFGCTDSDSDGWSDDGDLFSNNPTQWADRDGDGYGDNQSETATMTDAFSADGTQWNDTDGDGHGDNPFGTQGDWFPNDPTRWQDSDQDGFADENDAFPNEITQWNDTDGDGYGNEETGNRGDAFPNDAAEWLDSDMDGLGDNADAFPFDPTQKVDADGDGMGDNPMGIGADKFPDDITQWGDIDGDGYGDNQNGTNPDAFSTDATQWSDVDGDGYGDNPTGRQYDVFPDNPTQWLDEDGDGLGDNLSGTNADTSLNDFDNDGYNDSIDPLPKLASPGDLDNDGVLDVNDLFPEDFREWADYDGDGEGDNADTDDDNDGWADTDEVRLGTDPFGSADVPIDSFEIVIPGTAVGLGAWDLIGMFGGIPLFMWIGFGFVTRNGRTAKYEGLLREAQSRDELEDVARLWEYSLMLRMLGPHQGIRLERLRAELDDVFEAQNQKLSSIEPQQHDQTQMVEQAMQDETTHVGPMQMGQKSLPSIESTQPEITVQGNPDGKGYEWHSDGQGTSWYRNEDSNSEWQRFEA